MIQATTTLTRAGWHLSGKRAYVTYAAQFKMQVVQECRQPGASVASVAIRHGINANVVHRWLHEFDAGSTWTVKAAEFVPLALTAPKVNAPVAEARPIRLQLTRGNASIQVDWPVESAAACGAWLRDWFK